MKILILFAAILIGSLSVEAQKKTPIKMIQKTDNIYIPKQMNGAKIILPPKMDTIINLRLSRQKFNYFKQNKINISQTASELMENYNTIKVISESPLPATDISPMPSDNEKSEIISQRIIDNGGFEIKYADESKKILYNGGVTYISPDGRISQISYMQVSPVIPPSLPEDKDQVDFLQKINFELLGILSESLNNDSTSIANFNKGEGPNLYDNINRRIRFLNYINQQK